MIRPAHHRCAFSKTLRRRVAARPKLTLVRREKDEHQHENEHVNDNSSQISPACRIGSSGCIRGACGRALVGPGGLRPEQPD